MSAGNKNKGDDHGENEMKWLELMRTGEFTDRHGNKRNITTDILSKVAAGYDRAKAAAHLVVGHPDKPKVPSFGLVDKLKVVGDRLMFQPAQVVPEFAALVAKGAFPAVSAGLNAAMDALDHVAFLSAERPAIDGLAPIAEFSASVTGGDCVSIDVTAQFSSDQFVQGWLRWRMSDIAALFRKVREWIIETNNAEKADAIIPSYLIDNIGAEPPEEIAPAQFSQERAADMEYQKLYEAEVAKVTDLTGKLAEFSTAKTADAGKISTLETENASLKTQLAEFQAAMKRAEFSAFVEKLVADRKVLPAQKNDIVGKLMSRNTASVLAEFSAGTSPLEIYKAQLEALPVSVPGGDHTADLRGAEFSADDNPQALADRATAHMIEQAAKGRVLAPREAVAEVSRQ